VIEVVLTVTASPLETPATSIPHPGG